MGHTVRHSLQLLLAGEVVGVEGRYAGKGDEWIGVQMKLNQLESIKGCLKKCTMDQMIPLTRSEV